MDLSSLSDEELLKLERGYSQNPLPDHPVYKVKQSAGKKALGATRSLLDGLTMGYAGEIGSAILSGATGAPYRGIKNEYDKQQQEFQKKNPELDLLANVTGGLAGGGKIANMVMRNPIARANPMKAAAATGATGGAVAGAGYAPTMDDVPSYSAIGGFAGAAVGAASVPVGNAVSSIAENIGKKLAVNTPESGASKVLNEYLSYDMMTPQQLITNARRLGPEGNITDAGGESIKSLARYALQTPSRTRNAAYESLRDRQSGSFDRVMDSLRTLSRGDENYFRNQQNILQRRREEAGPLYQQALNTSVNEDDMTSFILRLNEAAGLDDDLRPILRMFIAGNGNNRRLKTSNKELHAVKRKLDDKISKEFRKGNGNLARDVGIYRDDLLRLMDEASPEYAQARRIYAEGSGLNDALMAGRNILKEDTDEIAANIANLSIAEQEMYINGAVKTIQDTLMKTRETRNVATKLSTRLVRDRLRNAGCPTELIDQLGGWSTGNIGSNYGQGYDVATSSEWIHKIATSNLVGCDRKPHGHDTNF